MHPILQRLKERKLVQWGLAYAAGAVALYQVLDASGEPWGASDGFLRIVQLALVVAFLVVHVLAWYHGEPGRQRVTGPELVVIAGILILGGDGDLSLSVGRGSGAGSDPDTRQSGP